MLLKRSIATAVAMGYLAANTSLVPAEQKKIWRTKKALVNQEISGAAINGQRMATV